MATYQFEKEWNETPDESRPWAIQGRKCLNVVIREFNRWQLSQMPPFNREPLLARIEWGKVQCDVDGGEEWIATLHRMEEFVKSQ